MAIQNTLPGDTEHNLPILAVSEISQALKQTVEETFARVRVRGEISGFKRAASGHLYFSLKDTDAVLDSVCWRGTAGRLRLKPEDGMEVVATGRLTTYPGRSKYQIVVEDLELTGEGALLKLLEERKKTLAAEGLFDDDRKQPLPFIPQVIGVVTSPTGAVIRDILHRVAERFPRRVLLWPVLVQGEDAAGQIAAAIQGFNVLAPDGPVPRPDLLIVARGGGSLEDLWAFNEEAVVRATAASAIPLISAIGHETDVTLIDFAADRRAPTPTAAAEMAVPVRMELLAQVLDDGNRLTQRLDDWTERLGNSLRVGLDRRHASVAEMAARLSSPRWRIDNAKGLLDGEARALVTAFNGLVRDRRARFAQAAALLESFSYQRVLERGFALVRDSEARPVWSVGQTAPGMGLSVRFHDGVTGVTVDGDAGPGGEPARRRRRQPSKAARGKPGPEDDPQGSLL
jgi:exodeoxyribonuclease VII large subunit